MKKWYKIQAKKNESAKVLIYDQIGENFWGEGVSAKRFINEIDVLDVKTINLHINSPGGSVFDGNSIYNALKKHTATINVTIDGIAASIASVIAMAGDNIEMPSNAMMMIHDPSGGAYGTASDMLKCAEALQKAKSGMVDTYSARTEIDSADIAEMMAEETWFTAKEAVEIGFADTITGEVKMSANFQALADFKNVPEALIDNKIKKPPRAKAPVKAKETKMEVTIDLIKSDYPEIFASILKLVTIESVRADHPEIIAALREEGAAAEVARIKAVKEQAMPGHEKLIAELMFDGKTTGEQAAVKVLAAERELRAQAIKDNDTDAPPVIQQPAPPDDGKKKIDDNLPLDEKIKAKWEGDPALRTEFDGDFEAYSAYEKAVTAGAVKQLG